MDVELAIGRRLRPQIEKKKKDEWPLLLFLFFPIPRWLVVGMYSIFYGARVIEQRPLITSVLIEVMI
jgi:hypothetical protein